VRGFVLGTIATAITFFIVTKLLPQFLDYRGDALGLIGLALIFGVVNGVIGPVLRIASLPLSIMTVGIVGFVVNGALLLITAYAADKADIAFKVGHYPPTLDANTLVAAVVAAVVIGLVGTAVRAVVPD
jgi:putative membrane protein